MLSSLHNTLSHSFDFSSFRRCLNNLIDDVNTRMEKDQSAARGGLIVNGGSWYEEDRSFPLLKEMIDRLDIGAVFVLHDGRIYVCVID